LSKVTKGFNEAQGEYIENRLSEERDSAYIHFGIDETGKRVMSAYEPCLGIFDVPLSQEQYTKLTKILLEIVHEIKDESPKKKAKQCSVAGVAFAKSSVFPTLS
jgi:hypothetical protein